MLTYRYYCMDSSPVVKRMPPDMTAYNVWGSRPYMPDLGGIVYGTVDYARCLSISEMNSYGLIPSNMVQQPITRQGEI